MGEEKKGEKKRKKRKKEEKKKNIKKVCFHLEIMGVLGFLRFWFGDWFLLCLGFCGEITQTLKVLGLCG